MFKFNNDTHKIKNSCLAMAIAIGGCLIPIQSQACCSLSDIPGIGQLADIGKKLIKDDFKGAGEEIIAPVKKVLTGIKGGALR